MLPLPIFLVFYRTGLIVKQYYTYETLQLATIHSPPMGTEAMQYHIGRPGVSSLSLGDQIYPFFQDRVQRSEARIGTSHIVLKNPRRAPKMKGCC